MHFLGQISSANCSSFFSNQLLKIQNTPLAKIVALVAVAIFAGITIGYISNVIDRNSRQRIQNTVSKFTLDPENKGTSITIPREQCQAVIQCPNAAWVQLTQENPAMGYVVNVLPSFRLPSNEILVCHQAFGNGSRGLSRQVLSAQEAQEQINNNEWFSLDDFKRATGFNT